MFSVESSAKSGTPSRFDTISWLATTDLSRSGDL